MFSEAKVLEKDTFRLKGHEQFFTTNGIREPKLIIVATVIHDPQSER